LPTSGGLPSGGLLVNKLIYIVGLVVVMVALWFAVLADLSGQLSTIFPPP
jgi:hypothetical protein